MITYSIQSFAIPKAVVSTLDHTISANDNNLVKSPEMD
jgi:hypothetical protein